MLLKAVMLADDAFVPPFATGNTPVTPVVSGKPVTLVMTPDAGVPSAGVTSDGLALVHVLSCAIVHCTLADVCSPTVTSVAPIADPDGKADHLTFAMVYSVTIVSPASVIIVSLASVIITEPDGGAVLVTIVNPAPPIGA